LHFYAYFSAYGNNQYDPNDMNLPEEPSARSYRANVNILAADYTNSPYEMISTVPNPYTTGPAMPANGFASFVNPNTFQIISAGADGYYGPGGTYAGETAGEKLPIDASTNQDLRNRERDNVTNFSRGRLD
jgi:general secretion pathway protein G